MSSILEALKKLEKDVGIGSAPPVWPKPPGVKKRAGLRKKVLLTSVVLIVVGATASYLAFDAMRARNAAMDEGGEGPLTAAAPVPRMQQVPSRSEPPLPSPLQRKRVVPASGVVRPSSPTSSFAVENRTEQKDANRPEANPSTSDDRQPIVEEASAPPARVEISRSPSAVQTGEEFPEKTDPRFRLQAIAWAEQSADRFAVVNDQIVREGSRVEAAMVVRIERRGIIFEENGAKWRQPFRIQ